MGSLKHCLKVVGFDEPLADLLRARARLNGDGADAERKAVLDMARDTRAWMQDIHDQLVTSLSADTYNKVFPAKEQRGLPGMEKIAAEAAERDKFVKPYIKQLAEVDDKSPEALEWAKEHRPVILRAREVARNAVQEDWKKWSDPVENFDVDDAIEKADSAVNDFLQNLDLPTFEDGSDYEVARANTFYDLASHIARIEHKRLMDLAAKQAAAEAKKARDLVTGGRDAKLPEQKPVAPSAKADELAKRLAEKFKKKQQGDIALSEVEETEPGKLSVKFGMRDSLIPDVNKVLKRLRLPQFQQRGWSGLRDFARSQQKIRPGLRSISQKDIDQILLSDAENYDPEMEDLAAEMVAEFVTAGVDKWADFVPMMANYFPGESLQEAEPVLRQAWDLVREVMPDATIDKSTPISEVLTNERTNDVSGSPEKVSAPPVQEPQGSGKLGGSGEGSGEKLSGDNEGVDRPGSDETGSSGSSDSGVDNTAVGGRGSKGSGSTRGGGRRGGRKPGRSSGSASAGGKSQGEGSTGVLPGGRPEGGKNGESQDGVSHDIKPTNFRIDPEEIGKGGPKQKYRDNVAAIKLVKQLRAEGRTHASRDEQAILAKYVGWGSLPAALNDTTDDVGDWTAERDELKQLLTPEEWQSAFESTINAHYTSPQIVQGMWEMAERLGFDGGRVIETSAGVGNFIGLQPAELAGASRWHAVELDTISGDILKLLYPDAMVRVQGYQEFPAPDSYYDLGIGNVPFDSRSKILSDPRYRKLKPNLHDFFFAKTIDRVRPGGLMMFITSTGTMDKEDQKVREYINDRADLVAAFRLPENTFGQNAGTAVVTDILIFKRRPDGTPANGPEWLERSSVADPDGGADIPINEYYVAHPENVLGTVDRKSRLYGKGQAHVSRTDDFEDRWQQAIESLPEGIFEKAADNTADIDIRFHEVGDVPGQIIFRDGKPMYVEPYQVVEIERPEPHPTSPAATTRRNNEYNRLVEMARDYQPLRAAAKKVVQTQIDSTPIEEREQARADYEEEYDKFVAKHGFVSSRNVAKALGDDLDYDLIASSEEWDEDEKKATKGDFFKVDTVSPSRIDTAASSIEQAIAVSLNTHSHLNIPEMAHMLGVSEDDVTKDLVEKNLAFDDPSAGWVVKDEYLSGDIRAKLADARIAAEKEPALKRNIEALEKVLPPDKPYSEIEIKAHNGWLPTPVLAGFSAHILGATEEDFNIRYLERTGQFYYKLSPQGESNGIDSTPLYTRTWGVNDRAGRNRVDFGDVMDSLLTQVPIRIYDKDSDGNSVLNHDLTEEANALVQALGEEFLDWVWADGERRENLAKAFNERHNSVRKREYDGSHLTFPGMAPHGTKMGSITFKGLRPHQFNAVWQVILRGKGLLAHEVGTGKTMTMVAAAMELRRLGLANKPCIVVPDSRVDATAREALQLYPTARVLTAARGMSEDKRKKMVARIATGNWDIVILTHENLKTIPVSARLRQDYLRRQVAEIEDLLRSEGVTDLSDKGLTAAGRGNAVVKRLARAIRAARERLDAAMSLVRDTGTTFEETGIDFLFVDEAHVFKSLPINTRLGTVKGIPTGSSDHALNLDLIASYLQDNNNGRGLVLATGTPITNSLAELYVMQRYIQRKELEAAGLLAFDAWQSVFGIVESRMEFNHAGGVKETSRFREFANLDQLRQLVSQDMDVLRVSENPDLAAKLNRPIRVDIDVVIPSSQEQIEYMQWIAARAQALRGPPQRGGDNHLNIATDGTKAAMDMRLVRNIEETEHSKAKSLVENLLRERAETPDGTQLIFLEKGNSTNPDFSVVEDIKKKLIEAGTPADKILDFQGVKSKDKDAMIERLKSGDAWYAFGNTKTLGTGVNAQDHIIAIHHLEPAWTPEALEQRNGRGWRQGNKNPKITIYTYLTENSLDSWRWGVVAIKARGIDNFLTGRGGDRMVEDDAEDFAYLGYERMQALASGNPLRMELINTENDIVKLTRAEARFGRNKNTTREQIDRMERYVKGASGEVLKGLKEDKEAYDNAVAAEEPLYTDFRGNTYTDRKEIAKAIRDAYRTRIHDNYATASLLGTWRGGFELHGISAGMRVVNGQMGYEAKLELRRTGNYYASAKGIYKENSRDINTGDPPVGIVQSIEYNLSHINQEIEKLEKDIAAKKKAIETMRADLEKPWRDAERLQNKRLLAQRLRDAIAAGRTTLAPEVRRDPRNRVEEQKAFEQPTNYREQLDEPKKKGLKKTGEKGAAKRVQKEADEEGDIVEDPGFFGGRKRKLRQQTNLPKDAQFDDPEVEAAVRAAHGGKRPPLKERIAGIVAKAWHVTTRTREHLPKDHKFDVAREVLRLADGSAQYNADEANRVIAAILDKIGDEAGRELFERKLLVDNILESVRLGQPARFRMKSGPDLIPMLERKQRQIDDLVKTNPAIQQALANRHAVVSELVEKLIKHDVLPEEAREGASTYFHQQVLGYLAGSQRVGKGSAGLERRKPGFAKRRTTGVPELEKFYDYNTNYIESESEWITDAYIAIRKEELRKMLGDEYDRMAEFKQKAKDLNFENVVGGPDVVNRINQIRGELAESRASEDAQDSGERARRKALIEEMESINPLYPEERQIAKMMAWVRNLVKSGEAPLGDFSYQEIMGEDIDGGSYFDVSEEEPGSQWFQYLRWLAKQPQTDKEDKSTIAANAAWKAIDTRNKKIEQLLGHRYETVDSLVAKDPTIQIWTPPPGNVWYRAFTIPEQIVESVLQGLTDVAEVKRNQIRQVLAMGGPGEQMVLPVELATQLESMMKPPDRHTVGEAIRTTMKSWKSWRLFSPLSNVMYRLKNWTGDINPVLAADPRIIGKTSRAFNELKNYYYGPRLSLTPELEAARNLNVMGSSLATQETLDLKSLPVFRRLYEYETPLWQIPSESYEAIKKFNEFNESILRYAAFLHYRELLEKHGDNIKDFGASSPITVRILRRVMGNDVAAAHIARNLLGDYGNLTVLGQWLRDYLMPFHSWAEVNLKRWPMLTYNAVYSGKLKSSGPRMAALLATRGIIGLLAMSVLMDLWNRIFFGDDEDKLSSEERSQPHLLFGHRSDGTIRILRGTGSLGDFLEWFGVPAAISLIPSYFNGQVTAKDIAVEMAKSPRNKLIQEIGPQIKLPVELVEGQTHYPDPFNPQPYPRDEILANTLGVRDEYKELKGRIMKTGERQRNNAWKKWFGSATIDPNREALNEAYTLRDRFLDSKGKPTTNIMRRTEFAPMREAAYNNDYSAFQEARQAYLAKGKTIDNFMDSINRLDPIERLSDELEAEFETKFLTPLQRQRVKDARDYSDHLRATLLKWWAQDAKENGTPEDRNALGDWIVKKLGKIQKTLRSKPRSGRNYGERLQKSYEAKQKALEDLEEISSLP